MELSFAAEAGKLTSLSQWETKGAMGWGWQNLEPYFAKSTGAYPEQEKCLEKSVCSYALCDV